MTERASREREPREGDFAQQAKSVVDEATREHDEEPREVDDSDESPRDHEETLDRSKRKSA